MNTEKICLSCKTIDIAEHETYLELTNRLCYYDDKNLNEVMLPYKGFEESALANAQTLINMPVQAKYKKIAGKDDLGSHEMRVLPDGQVEFGTVSIGTHTDVEIKDDTVTTVNGDTKVLPCLFATSRIWKRYPNMVAAVKRLYETDDGLNSSWEIVTSAYEYKDGVKILKDYEFIGDTLLGSTTTPAYKGTSKTLSLSALSDTQLMVAEALSLDLSENQGETFDINNNQEKEDFILKKDKETNLSSEEKVDGAVTAEKVNADNTSDVTDNPETNSAENTGTSAETGKIDDGANSTDAASLTAYDLRRKVSQACRNKYDDWCWVTYLFPEDHEVWCEYDGDSELDYLKFTYTVEGDEVTVSEPEKVKLSVSVSEINATIAQYEQTIKDKDEIILKSSSEITALKAQNTELSQYKEKFEKAEQEKIEAEIAEKKENLIASIVKSGQITREEIESSEELSGYVDNLDKKSLMAIVGERLMASVENTDSKVETSTADTDTVVSSNLNNEDDTVDEISIMRNYLRK